MFVLGNRRCYRTGCIWVGVIGKTESWRYCKSIGSCSCFKIRTLIAGILLRVEYFSCITAISAGKVAITLLICALFECMRLIILAIREVECLGHPDQQVVWEDKGHCWSSIWRNESDIESILGDINSIGQWQLLLIQYYIRSRAISCSPCVYNYNVVCISKVVERSLPNEVLGTRCRITIQSVHVGDISEISDIEKSDWTHVGIASAASNHKQTSILNAEWIMSHIGDISYLVESHVDKLGVVVESEVRCIDVDGWIDSHI
jgi:hypothetical protein